MTADARAMVASRLAELLEGADLRDARAFWGRQYDLGLARVHFAVGCGGLGVDPSYQQVVDEAVAAAGAPSNRAITGVGPGYAAPTIEAHGTPEQKARYLRPIFTGEEMWCQLFSEPGAGSDLAALATRAVRDGDGWLVSGQKVWTSLAHKVGLTMLLARTDPAVPKHKGLSFFIIDMHAPGVDVRPLRQMTGEAEFNEVYLTDVRLPATAQIGELGSGWRVAMTTLANERQTWISSDAPREAGFIGTAVHTWRERGHADPVRRDELVRLWVKAEVYRLNSIRAAQAMKASGPEGSIGKIVSAELNKEISAFTVDLLGGDGLLYSGYDATPGSPEGLPFELAEPQRAFLRARAFSVEAGSTEINKNVLAERVLGLPGDIRIDKDVPWSQLRRT